MRAIREELMTISMRVKAAFNLTRNPNRNLNRAFRVLRLRLRLGLRLRWETKKFILLSFPLSFYLSCPFPWASYPRSVRTGAFAVRKWPGRFWSFRPQL